MNLVRLLNLVVVAALVLAAAYVYKIKFESTLQAERVAKLRTDIRKERDAVAALRAEWSELASPARIQGLAQRHLALKPVEATQFDSFDHLPDRPPQVGDPIGSILDTLGDAPTGSIGKKAP
jgi:cell division protein FtsL